MLQHLCSWSSLAKEMKKMNLTIAANVLSWITREQNESTNDQEGIQNQLLTIYSYLLLVPRNFSRAER
jgi:hypothetical protein